MKYRIERFTFFNEMTYFPKTPPEGITAFRGFPKVEVSCEKH